VTLPGYEAWPEGDFGQQPVGQLPRGHDLVLLTKVKGRDAHLAPTAALERGWSRGALVHHKALTSFADRLPRSELVTPILAQRPAVVVARARAMGRVA
jgi:hypothetical protein